MRPETGLVCCAVNQEAAPLRRWLGTRRSIRVLVTGMGPDRARARVASALPRCQPSWVVSSGFAGGLNPRWSLNDVLYEGDVGFAFLQDLQAAGAHPARLLTSNRVLATARAKNRAWVETQADAVDMESAAIRTLCHDHGIPSATVRVVSDTASEDLPLDFNTCLGTDGRIRWIRLLRTVGQRPRVLLALLQFRPRLTRAAGALARVLARALPGSAPE